MLHGHGIVSQGTVFYNVVLLVLLLLFFVGVIIYLALMTPHFSRGLKLLYDVAFWNYTKCEIVYQTSITDYYHEFPVKQPFFIWSKKIQQGVASYLQIYCKSIGGLELELSSSRYHGMVSGRKYNVIYGKYSKVLFSIKSEDGDELLDIPFENYALKESEILGWKKQRKNRKYKSLSKDSAALRKRVRVPYFKSLGIEFIYYIVSPVVGVIVVAGIVFEIRVILLAILTLAFAVFLKFVFITPMLLSGLKLVRDIRCSSLETCEIQYQGGKRESIAVKESIIDVSCKKSDKKLFMLTAIGYHGMIQGKTYTVTYGKHSKFLFDVIVV